MTELNGIVLADLELDGLIPALVPNRILQLDGDMLCYECCGEDDQPFAYCKENFQTALATRMTMAGAEYCNIHLTGADKGGRFDIALVKPYQGNRDGKIKPKHLPALREWVRTHYSCHNDKADACYHNNQEADDGITQRQYAAIKQGARHLSIIMSGDKDLGICSGLHCDWNNYSIQDVQGFGGIYLDETGSTKKIKGKGTSFFWAQLLMGDTADSIPGCPSFGINISTTRWPSKSYSEAVDLLTTRQTKTGKPASALQIAKANDVIAEAKAKACGAVTVYDYLKEADSDKAAFRLCYGAYLSHYGKDKFPFTCHRGNKYLMTARDMLIEQARLLWMRRVENECPTVFFKEILQDLDWEGNIVQKA